MWAKLSKGDMRKKIIITIITTFAVATLGGVAVSAYVHPSNIRGVFRDYAEFVNSDTQRFKYRNTLSITRIDLKNNRIFVLFDVEYLLKMDKRKQFFGEMMANGIGELVLGWPGDNLLYDEARFLNTPLNRGGRHEYYDYRTLFRERLAPYGGFQIPDMIEVELPASMLRARLAENKQGRLYYYLEAFGFYTDGYIDFRACYEDYDNECYLVITGDDRLEYTSFRRLNTNFIEVGGSFDDIYPGVPEINTVEPEVIEPEIVEPEPEVIVREVVEPETIEPEIIEEPKVVEPEVVIPEPEVEIEPEPVVEVVVPEMEPEPEPEPEPDPELELEAFEPDAEPEPIIEVASAPTSEEIAEPENDKLALELGSVALVAENKPTGGEAAVKEMVFSELLAPNTGYKNREKAWGFLVLPLIGAGILAVWWLWPFKFFKKVKKSLKKVLTFFAISDKMVTVY